MAPVPSLRRLPLTLPATLFATLLLAAGSAAAVRPATTVSPGDLERAVELATPCPTFSWAAVAGASGYELAVLDLARPDEPVVILRHQVAGAALSWTPDRARCLAPSTYAWTVRALDAAGAPLGDEEGWAVPRQFTVSALPDDAEIAAALDVLRRWEAGGAGRSTGPQAGQRAAASRSGRGPAGEAVEVSGTAAVRGENPAASGTQHGVWGQTSSAAGAGLVAVNLAGGPDLVLDGVAPGQADTRLSQSGIDRPSASAQTFNLQNTGGGGMSLQVGGSSVWHAANDGPGSGLDADTLDGQQGANYQMRVTGTCPLGQAVRAVNTDGSVVCYEIPVPPVIETVDDPANSVGYFTSIAIGSDGFPVVSYYDFTAGALKVAKCSHASCSSRIILTVDDPANDVGFYSSIAIGSDGFPVISYQDLSTAALKVAKCRNASCLN